MVTVRPPGASRVAWAAVALLTLASRGDGAPNGYWVEATPSDAAETQLRAALGAAGSGDPVTALQALSAVSTGHPGSVASGLAQMAAGFALLDANRGAEAIPFLLHPDIQRTALNDRAVFGLARAHEAAKKDVAAGQTFLRAADLDTQGPLFCPALLRGADALSRAGQAAPAIVALNRALTGCPGQQPQALLRLGQVQETGDNRAAAQAYDRLEREFPASVEAVDSVKRLRALAAYRPAITPPELASRAFRRAVAVAEAGRNAEAIPLLRALPLKQMPPADADLVRVRLGTALLARGKVKDAQAQLSAVSAGSPVAAEATFQAAKIQAQRQRKPSAYETVVARFPGTPWAEEALATLALYHQREGRDEPALPYYRRLLQDHPQGRYGDRAIWWLAWADYRRGRYEEAASALERAARSRPLTSFTPAYLYWAGRARARLGQNVRAASLLGETVQRFKNQYHGLRAQEALAQVPGAENMTAPAAVIIAAPADPRKEIPEKPLARIRQLLLIDRYDEAFAELQRLSPSPLVQGTMAWVEWKRGRLRPAITAMKRAYPYYAGAAGDRLPDPVWRILYPLDFGDILEAKSRERGLDPALVAAVVLQESTFDAAAVSSAGARGLMQVMLRTGRQVSRNLGQKNLKKGALHDAETSLTLGTSYLRQILNRFGGRVERALAAYNAGPSRVATWTAAHPDMSAEEFVDSIPFVETRGYVMIILAGREHYRRLYSFAPRPQTPSARAEAP
jgi:soluble lytic murein transglycosylase